MSLDHLWAGWRSAYVAAAVESSAGEVAASRAAAPLACVFCHILAGEDVTALQHLVARSKRSAALLNAYPYTSGHLLVMPIRHVATLEELDEDEAAELWRMAREAVRALQAAYQPDGMNLGANLGRAAGAGIPGHLHLHALPRWHGDTNFMTSVAGARVLPESLDISLAKLQAAWPS